MDDLQSRRDLAREDLWAESLERSRARREAAAAAKGFELPTRSLSVAALVAVTGGVVASKAMTGGDDPAQASSGGGERPAAVAKHVQRRAHASVAERRPAP